MLATALHMMRGVPFVYMGEEIGMPNAYFTDISQYRDVESTNIYSILLAQGKEKEEILHILQERSRDNARTPMPWTAGENAGFTTGEPWLPIAESYREVNVEDEVACEDSIFKTYQALIKMRKTMPLVQDGRYIPQMQEHDRVFAYKRVLGDEELLVINNFYADETEVTIDPAGYEVILSNYKDTVPSADMKLRPYESFVLYKKN